MLGGAYQPMIHHIATLGIEKGGGLNILRLITYQLIIDWIKHSNFLPLNCQFKVNNHKFTVLIKLKHLSSFRHQSIMLIMNETLLKVFGSWPWTKFCSYVQENSCPSHLVRTLFLLLIVSRGHYRRSELDLRKLEIRTQSSYEKNMWFFSPITVRDLHNKVTLISIPHFNIGIYHRLARWHVIRTISLKFPNLEIVFGLNSVFYVVLRISLNGSEKVMETVKADY